MAGALPIPDAALAAHIGILGKTGSGKSNAAKVVAEVLMFRGERVCVVDPTGTWWGLRLDRARMPSRFQPVIFGGAYGDLAIGGQHGAAIGEAIGTASTSAIIDTRLLSVGDRTRFFTEFAEALLRRNQGPLHLIIDEAHLFAPQAGAKAGGAAPAMLHAANNLVSLGRGVGLRIILISQRPAKLHKDSLTQVETLVAMRLLHNLDVDAVRAWIGEWADPAQGRELVASLPSLGQGDAWVWSPEARILDRVHFPLAVTFDSGKPPKVGETGPELRPIDISAIAGRLEAIGKEVLQNDPRALKARVAELERQLRDAAAVKGREPNAREIERARQDGFDRGHIAGETVGINRGLDELERLSSSIERAIHNLNARRDGKRPAPPKLGRNGLLEERPVTLKVTDPAPLSKTDQQIGRKTEVAPSRASNEREKSYTGDLPRPIAKLLDAIAWWNALGVVAPSYAQIAHRAGYSPRGGTFGRYLSELRSRGLAIATTGRAKLTAAGAASAAEPDALPDPEQLRQAVLAQIDGPLARLLRPLLEAYPGGLSKHDLGERAGYEASGGTFNRYLSSLRSLELAQNAAGGTIAAAEWLFP